MEIKSGIFSKSIAVLKTGIGDLISRVPVLGWIFGVLVAVILEYFIGTFLALALGLPKIPVLFGFVIMLKKPLLIPGALVYVLLIYILPVSIIARLCAKPANRLAAKLSGFPIGLSVVNGKWDRWQTYTCFGCPMVIAPPFLWQPHQG